VVVLILSTLMHRFALIGTPAGLASVAISWGMLASALALGVIGLIRVWTQGIEGLRDAVIGIVVAATSLAMPAYLTLVMFRLPQLNDISTDRADPPVFSAAPSIRPADANASAYPGGQIAARQERYYPDLNTYRSNLGVEETYEAVRQVAEKSGWTIVVQNPPINETSVAGLEAVEASLIMGFQDDIAVRVVPDETGALVDIRSASRYGRHDLGANAGRVRRFLGALREEIAPTAGGEK
jgi:uncharacterized protein (DUF1499 family)